LQPQLISQQQAKVMPQLIAINLALLALNFLW
jgi:hypothetical protein